MSPRIYDETTRRDLETKATHDWHALLWTIGERCAARGLRIHVDSNAPWKAQRETHALAYTADAPRASLRAWGYRTGQYRVVIESADRYGHGTPLYSKLLKNVTADELVNVLLVLWDKRKVQQKADRENAKKKVETAQRKTVVEARDNALFGKVKRWPSGDVMPQGIVGPCHQASIDTETSGHRVTSTFKVSVDDQAPPALRAAFEALVRQWVAVAKAHPYLAQETTT